MTTVFLSDITSLMDGRGVQNRVPNAVQGMLAVFVLKKVATGIVHIR